MSENPKEAFGNKKVPTWVVPATVIMELAVAMFEGALKYGAYNWRQTAVKASTYYSATDRHLKAWFEGEDIDPDSGISHITKAIASLTVLRDSMMNNKFIDDRPVAGPKEILTGLNKDMELLIEKHKAG